MLSKSLAVSESELSTAMAISAGTKQSVGIKNIYNFKGTQNNHKKRHSTMT